MKVFLHRCKENVSWIPVNYFIIFWPAHILGQFVEILSCRTRVSHKKLRGRLYTVEVFVGIEVFVDFPRLYNGFEVFVGLGAASTIQSDHLAYESTRIAKECNCEGHPLVIPYGWRTGSQDKTRFTNFFRLVQASKLLQSRSFC